MGAIRGQLSASPGITNVLIIVLYKTTDPTTEIARLVKPLPHSSPYSYQFSDLDAGNYIVNVHESTDGTTLGNLRLDYWEATVNSNTVTEQMHFTVDGGGLHDPNDGDVDYINEDLDGFTIDQFFQAGNRFLIKDNEWEQKAGGGITLINGDTFVSLGVWSFVVIYSVIETVSPSANGPFTEIVVKTTDATLVIGELNKAIYVDCASQAQDTTLAPISTIAAGSGYLIIHGGNNCINVKIKANSSETIRFRGEDVNYFYLGAAESAKLVKSGSIWYVTEKDGQWERVGQRIGVDDVGLNMLATDELGTILDGDVYRRLYEWIENLNPSQQISFAAWDADVTKQCFYAIETSTREFKLPKMNGQTDKYRTDVLPGTFQEDQVGEFTLEFTGYIDSKAGTGDSIQILNNRTGTNAPVVKSYTINSGNKTQVDNVGRKPVVLI